VPSRLPFPEDLLSHKDIAKRNPNKLLKSSLEIEGFFDTIKADVRRPWLGWRCYRHFVRIIRVWQRE
jgi:hypothetical protein